MTSAPSPLNVTDTCSQLHLSFFEFNGLTSSAIRIVFHHESGVIEHSGSGFTSFIESSDEFVGVGNLSGWFICSKGSAGMSAVF